MFTNVSRTDKRSRARRGANDTESFISSSRSGRLNSDSIETRKSLGVIHHFSPISSTPPPMSRGLKANIHPVRRVPSNFLRSRDVSTPKDSIAKSIVDTACVCLCVNRTFREYAIESNHLYVRFIFEFRFI